MPRLIAVLDWEAAAIGDPAIDLAGLWYLGNDWANAVLDALGSAASERRRCAAWRVVRELEGAAWSTRHGDDHERHESAAKLVTVVRDLRDGHRRHDHLGGEGFPLGDDMPRRPSLVNRAGR